MAITLNANWIAAANADGAKPALLMAITNGTSTWKAGDRETTLGYAPSVLSVSPTTTRLDPVDRKIQISAAVVDVEDDWIRPILVNNRLRAQKATLSLGWAGLAENDYIGLHAGPISRIIPGAASTTIEVMDVLWILRQTMITGIWFNIHPLEAIEDILINKVGLPAAFVDTTSLDPSTHTELSHWVVARVGWSTIANRGDTALREPSAAFDVISELAQMMDGHIRVDEDGKISFARFDATASAAASWGLNDLLEFKQGDKGDNIINHVAIKFLPEENIAAARKAGTKVFRTKGYLGVYEQRDTDSQTNYAYPGMSSFIASKSYELDWLNSAAFVLFGISSVGTSLKVGSMSSMRGFIGTRSSYPSASQPADAKISGSRPAYIQIGTEVLKVTAMAFDDLYAYQTNYVDLDGDITPAGFAHLSATLTVVRAQLGTTAAAHFKNAQVFDITIPLSMASARLDRWGDGATPVECQTTLAEYGVEVGDLVTPTHPRFLDFGLDGLDGTRKFEVIGKKTEHQKGRIVWSLLDATVDAATTRTHPQIPIPPPMITGSLYGNSDLLDSLINSGLEVTHTSGREVQVGSGSTSAIGGAVASALQSAILATLPASKDTYITSDPVSGSIGFESVANGAAEPDHEDTAVILAKVVTDATAVTAVDATHINRSALGASLLSSSGDRTRTVSGNWDDW